MFNIPGFYNFQSGGQGDPHVSMLVAAIPVMPADAGGGSALPMAPTREDLRNLVLVYHLFFKERDPFCVIVPSRT
ncbi:MAG: hypothetical protein HN919_21895 [Verrucomicrobia bacterium]|jgi:hypothetical protein|nr:hypothetical protein [Verrucomicrobiota bacterium]MBT7068965.1 hypothetical protein [Verrucomicrobiota bacterium]MBT7702034.1 hypothetical protein [Verrucomicrobiota bacterium]